MLLVVRAMTMRSTMICWCVGGEDIKGNAEFECRRCLSHCWAFDLGIRSNNFIRQYFHEKKKKEEKNRSCNNNNNNKTYRSYSNTNTVQVFSLPTLFF